MKKSCASSLLSHLFNQGVVSGQLILEPDFRKLCRDKAPSGYKTLFDDANFDARKTEIVYGIITKNADKVPASLPFFSKQTLLNSISTLTKYGYSVSVAGIDDRT